jgi:UDP-glucose 4-epimerase
MTQTWLVTGGAGYVGAHVLRCLVDAGHDVVTVDDLSTGDASRVTGELVVGDCGDGALMHEVLRRHRVSGVVHLAAGKSVEESVRAPVTYYRRNVSALVELLAAMDDCGVDRLVYSSSAAVYGETQVAAVTEDEPANPVSPYGESKVVGEWLIRAQARATGLRYASLRYFNVAGTADPLLADTSVANLIPLTLRAIAEGVPPRIFGADYPTPDGTCVRDYVHAADVARAHVDVIATLDRPGAGAVFNVGSGSGYSVREVVDVALAVTGSSLEPEVTPRRPGDPPQVVADVTRLTSSTAWRPQEDLTSMVRSAWAARQGSLRR